MSTYTLRTRAIGGMLGLAGLVSAASCATSLTVPDLNLPAVSEFQSNPTLSGANAFVIGIIRGVRDNAMNETQVLGQVGREGYSLCSCSGLQGSIELPINSSAFLVGQIYTVQYTDLREAQIILSALPKITGITAQQSAAMAGFVQTMEAVDLSTLIFTRDSFGIVVSPNPDPLGPPGPVAPPAAAYQYIQNLLDSGYANLQNGGSAFTFTLSPGFAGFDTPATFATVNRALRARIDIHTNNYAQALIDLQNSFLSTAAPLSNGVIMDFSTSSGDETNVLFNSYYRAETHYLDSAQLQPSGQPDLRWTNKVLLVSPLTYIGVTSPYQFTADLNAASPLPLIRNEELILMRAEANVGLNNIAAALPDLNLVRQESGGLAPLTLADLPNQAAALSELLYNKKYSMWWEDGIRWIDLKHYGGLGNLPDVIPGGKIYDIFPFWIADCNAYPANAQPAGCTTVDGISGQTGGGGG
jgi:starch-binding outer membrane protein, SusD/RagB family